MQFVCDKKFRHVDRLKVYNMTLWKYYLWKEKQVFLKFNKLCEFTRVWCANQSFGIAINRGDTL